MGMDVMRSMMLATNRQIIVLTALCSLGILLLLAPISAQGQVSRALFNLDTKGNDGSTVQAANREVSIDTTVNPEGRDSPGETSPGSLLPTIATKTGIPPTTLAGVVASLVAGGVLIRAGFRRRKNVQELIPGLTHSTTMKIPAPTPTQREAAIRKAAALGGHLNDPALAREYLKRLQYLPARVDGYSDAASAINVVFLLCRDTEKQEPLLCDLLTEGWHSLTSYQQSVSEMQWRKADSDRFRNLLCTLTFETEALIQKSTEMSA